MPKYEIKSKRDSKIVSADGLSEKGRGIGGGIGYFCIEDEPRYIGDEPTKECYIDGKAYANIIEDALIGNGIIPERSVCEVVAAEDDDPMNAPWIEWEWDKMTIVGDFSVKAGRFPIKVGDGEIGSTAESKADYSEKIPSVVEEMFYDGFVDIRDISFDLDDGEIEILEKVCVQG